MTTSKATQKSTKSTATDKTSKGFSAEERAAMKERAQELKAEERMNKDRAAGESAVLAKIAEMPEPDRALAKRLHALITASAPALSPKTWYGMPTYATDGKVVCYFQSAHRFKSRYATLGFSNEANLDEGAMWPTSFAVKKLTATEEARITALVKRADELRTDSSSAGFAVTLTPPKSANPPSVRVGASAAAGSGARASTPPATARMFD